jgi:hypothetical protein
MAPTFLFLVVLHCGIVEAADDNRPRYSLKQDRPDTGTYISKDVVSGSVIPLDKRYAELSPKEQSYVKSQYENLGPNDEPPFPVDGLRPIYKAIAAVQQKLLVTGEMTLAVEVNPQGQATSVSALRSADPEMTKLAATVLMLQRYKPALCNGDPCIMQFPFRIAFTTRP